MARCPARGGAMVGWEGRFRPRAVWAWAGRWAHTVDRTVRPPSFSRWLGLCRVPVPVFTLRSCDLLLQARAPLSPAEPPEPLAPHALDPDEHP